jgi:serine protease Do
MDGGSWLGIVIEEVDEETAEEMKLDRVHGVLVKGVEDDSPAFRAGLEKGDVIVEFDGEKVSGVHALIRMVRETPEGRTVDIEVLRDGRRETLQADLEERSSHPRTFVFREGEGHEMEFEIPEIDIRIPEVFRFVGHRPRLGVAVEGLNSQLAEFLGVDGEDGVFIKEVMEDTPAERAGLKAGDVILEVNGREVDDVGALSRALHHRAGETVSILIVRNKSERTIEATLEEENEDDEEWEDSRSLRREEFKEAERALREARRVQREAMREYRAEARELQRLKRDRHREELRALPYYRVRRGNTPVEI